MTRQRVLPVLVPPACALLAVLASLGLASGRGLLGLLPLAVAAAYATALVYARPWTAPLLAIIVPFLVAADAPGFGSSLIPLGTLLLLTVAAVQAWPSARPQSRRAAGLISGLGSATLLIGLGLSTRSSAEDGAGGIGLAVLFATLVGVTAALASPPLSATLVVIGGLGAAISIAAIASPALRLDRNTVIVGENANGVGFTAALAVIACLVALRHGNRLLKLAAAPTIVLACTGVFVTGSRGALVTLAVGASVSFAQPLLAGPPARAIVVGTLLAGLMVVSSGPVTSRFAALVGRDASGSQVNVTARESSLAYAVSAGLEHPVTGVGLGELAAVSRDDPASRLDLRAHNVYAGLFAEAGLLPLGLMLLICGLAIARTRRHASSNLLPIVSGVIVGGFSLEWWGSGRTGPIALLVIGCAMSAHRHQLPESLRGGLGHRQSPNPSVKLAGPRELIEQ